MIFFVLKKIILVLAISAAVARIWFIFYEHTHKTELPNIEATVTVRITDDPDLRDSWAQVIGASDKYGGILMRLPRQGNYQIGDEIVVSGKLTRPRNFFSDTGKEFDYIDYLAKDDIVYLMSSPTVISHTHSTSWSFARSLVSIKKWFINSVQQSLSEPYASLAVGLVVGGKSSLGKDWAEAFRRAGLIHAVVLSGYNVSIIVTILVGLIAFTPKHVRFVLGTSGIIAFALMTGASSTIVRASIMAIIALYGEVTYAQYSVLKALMIAALVMVMWNPLILLYDPSFHLSFLATLGLILLSEPMAKLFAWLPIEFLREVVSTTLATQILVTPYILYLMDQISIPGIITNILVTPILPFTMLMITLVAVLSSWMNIGVFYIGHEVVTFVAHAVLVYIFKVVEIISSMKIATVVVPRFSLTSMVVCYAIVAAIILLVKLRARRKVLLDD